MSSSSVCTHYFQQCFQGNVQSRHCLPNKALPSYKALCACVLYIVLFNAWWSCDRLCHSQQFLKEMSVSLNPPNGARAWSSSSESPRCSSLHFLMRLHQQKYLLLLWLVFTLRSARCFRQQLFACYTQNSFHYLCLDWKRLSTSRGVSVKEPWQQKIL